MNKRSALACIIAAGFFLLVLPGCKKLLDYITPRPDDKANNCRIEKVTSNFTNPNLPGESLFFDTAWFAYNAHGNPVSIKYVFPDDEIFTNDKAFKYDHHNRLSVYLDGVPNNLIALFWHKYTYIGDYIIIDSTFEYAQGDWSVNDVPDDAEDALMSITRYELDYLGRVIKETGGFYDENITYTYDSNGNLVKPGVNYSNKINLRRTNKVWMFLDRDYSLNSPVGDASQYNGEKLPVKLNEMPQFIYDADFGFNDIVVKYKCKN